MGDFFGYTFAPGDETFTPRHTSVTSLTSFADCPTAWWFDKIAKRPRKPETKGQKNGKIIHQEWDHHFKYGTDLGPMTLPGKKFIPAGALASEVPLAAVDGGGNIVSSLYADGIPLIGSIDIQQTHRVIDIKGVKDKQYCVQSPLELAKDIQLTAYSLSTWQKFQHRDPMDIRHWYHFNQGTPVGSWVLDGVLTFDQAMDQWAPMNDVARDLREIARTPSLRLADIPADTTKCKSFGGCHHLDVCPKGSAAQLANIFGEQQKKNTAIEIPDFLTAPNPTNPQKDIPMTTTQAPTLQSAVDRLKAAEQSPGNEAARVIHLLQQVENTGHGFPPLSGAIASVVSRIQGWPEGQDITGSGTLATMDPPISSFGELLELAESLQVPPDVVAYQPPPVNVPAPAPVAYVAPEVPQIAPPAAAPVPYIAPAPVVETPVAAPVSRFTQYNTNVTLPPVAQTLGVSPPDAPSPDQNKPARGRKPRQPKENPVTITAQSGVTTQTMELTPNVTHVNRTVDVTPPAEVAPVKYVANNEASLPAGAEVFSRLPDGRVVYTLPTNPVVAAPVESRPPLAVSLPATPTIVAPPQTAPVPQVPATPPPPANHAKKLETTQQTKTQGLHLFIDCLPTNGQLPESLAEYVHLAAKRTAEQFGVLDIRAADSESPLAYNKWKAILSQVVVSNPPRAGSYFVATYKDEFAEVIATALSNIAATATRAVR